MSNKILLDSTGRALLTEDGKVLVAPKSSSGGQSVPLAVKITYDELKTLRDSNSLVVGQQYRITDYQCTTTEPNTKSGNHQFDIIVVADSTNTLNENARAVQHEGDTYFAESNLSAWELKYDLDNDTTKYAWADEVNGKGVIYWLKDEFNNEVPYDFKNIIYTKNVGFTYNQWGGDYVFSRDSSLDTNGYYGWRTDRKVNGLEQDYCYTTVETPTTDMTMYSDTNGSVISFGGNITSVASEGWEKYTFDCYGADGSLKLKEGHNAIDSAQVYNNTINIYYFKKDPMSRTIIKLNFIIFDIANYCYGNKFGINCYSNFFGYDARGVIFGNGCNNNSFGSSPYNIILGNDCSRNKFGQSSSQITLGNYCIDNEFNDDCYNITFGEKCNNIIFEQSYANNIIIENGVSYITLISDGESSGYIQNVHIHQGVKGTYEEQKVITVARNLDYETTISTVEMQPKLTAGEGITIENNVISINYKNGDTEAY